MKKVCHSCEYCTDKHHKLDPLGEWKWCKLHKKDIHEYDETCAHWKQVTLYY